MHPSIDSSPDELGDGFSAPTGFLDAECRLWRPDSWRGLSELFCVDVADEGRSRVLMNWMPLCGEDGVEGRGELGVLVTNEELDCCCLLGECHAAVPGMLGHPVRRWAWR